MPMWHSDQNKKKVTVGKRKPYRTRRPIDVGGYPTETRLGVAIRKVKKIRGSAQKIKLLKESYANVSNLVTRKTVKVPIAEIIENTANIDYNRRRVITRGAVIDTSIGRAVVTSRPGQDGVINAVLLSE